MQEKYRMRAGNSDQQHEKMLCSMYARMPLKLDTPQVFLVKVDHELSIRLYEVESVGAPKSSSLVETHMDELYEPAAKFIFVKSTGRSGVEYRVPSPGQKVACSVDNRSAIDVYCSVGTTATSNRTDRTAGYSGWCTTSRIS